MKARGGYYELETVVVEASTSIFGADWDLWWGSSWNCCSYCTCEHDGDIGIEHGKGTSHPNSNAVQNSTSWLSVQGPEAHFLQRHPDQIFLQCPHPSSLNINALGYLLIQLAILQFPLLSFSP